MKITVKTISAILLLLFIYGCARISSPKGGPQDDIPPTLISSLPDSAQINYKGNTVALTFDEWIKPNGIESNLIITPSIEGGFKTKVNKKSILLTFKEPFQDSTTYTFNFGNSIQDITNNNSPQNLKLSFSTGPYIDSLEISGHIVDLYTQDPAENTLISLYALNDTLDITSGKAAYFAKTDTAGYFKLTNLPYNKYLIYACLDKNNNLKAETDSEAYGFYLDTLDLTHNITGVDFSIQRLNTKPLGLLASRPYGKYFDIGFNKPITDYDIRSYPNDEAIYFHQNEPDNIRLYNMDRAPGDTAQLILTAYDSIQTEIIDTIAYYFIDSKIKADAFTYQVSPSVVEVPAESQVELIFSKPVNSINLDSIYYQLDSINRLNLIDSELTWNSNKTSLTWNLNYLNNFTENKIARLNIKPAAFISIENDSSVQNIKKFNLSSLQESALISGKIDTNVPSFIVQIIDASQMTIISEVYNEKSFNFKYVNAGNYFIRLIIDTNANGLWDTGNILTKTAPEPAQYYYDEFNKTKMITIRKNWEMTDLNIIYHVDN
jgi:Bacterial Ig-like domain